ncbi:hypothetical protein TYRP_009853, partial [Tyrophagus putrescentiae]
QVKWHLSDEGRLQNAVFEAKIIWCLIDCLCPASSQSSISVSMQLIKISYLLAAISALRLDLITLIAFDSMTPEIGKISFEVS